MSLFNSNTTKPDKEAPSNFESKIAFSFVNDMDKQFRATKVMMYVVMFFCIAISGLVIFKSFSFARQVEQDSRRIIYSLDQNDERTYIGLRAVDKSVNRRAEAKYHMKNFHKIFYTLYPNLNQIKKNIIEAGHYGDRSILRLYEDYLEKQYYPQIVQGNVHQFVDVDSIAISSSKPLRIQTFATLTLVRETVTEKHELVTENFLTEVYRTEENPSGFQIEKFKEVIRRKISETKRD